MNLRALSSVLFLASVALAHADVAYSNLGIGDAFDPDAAWTVSSGSSVVGVQTLAQRFTSTATGRLTAIEFAGTHYEGGGSLRATLYADATDAPGSSLEDFDVDLSGAGESGTLFALTSAGGVSLWAGQHYWLGLVAQGDAWLGWNLAAPALVGDVMFDYEAGGATMSSDSLSAMRVTVQAVPEPASMLALGLGAAVALRRRNGR